MECSKKAQSMGDTLCLIFLSRANKIEVLLGAFSLHNLALGSETELLHLQAAQIFLPMACYIWMFIPVSQPLPFQTLISEFLQKKL